MRNKIISIIIIVAVLWTNCCIAFATTSQQYKNQAAEAKANSEKAKNELNDVKTELNGALQDVSDLRQKLFSHEWSHQCFHSSTHSLSACSIMPYLFSLVVITIL